MKNEGALRMRFQRHVGIYRSDVSSLQVNPGRGSAFRSGPGQAIGRAGKNTPFPSSAMSSGRLFLDRVARQHCPSPLHRHHQNKTVAARKGTDYHRTVPGVLTLCLTRGAHPRELPTFYKHVTAHVGWNELRCTTAADHQPPPPQRPMPPGFVPGFSLTGPIAIEATAGNRWAEWPPRNTSLPHR